MTLKRYKILKSAISHLGNTNENDRYLSGGYNWCSEFVSTVYKEAGAPFTDGSYSTRIENPPDNGKWMQRTSERILRWFKSNARYMHRGDPGWYDIDPRVGDFVLIGRFGTDRLHSGIVEFVESNGTLNTIEGNNAGRPVMRFKYPLYRINDRDNGLAHGIILGLGILPE